MKKWPFCHRKPLFFKKHWNFQQKLQPNVTKNLEQLTSLNEILIFNININILKILTLVLILNLDFWEYWSWSWYCVWKKYWSWYWSWSWLFFRDNIDIDLDIENKILENIDIDIEPQFDIVPPLIHSRSSKEDSQ